MPIDVRETYVLTLRVLHGYHFSVYLEVLKIYSQQQIQMENALLLPIRGGKMGKVKTLKDLENWLHKSQQQLVSKKASYQKVLIAVPLLVLTPLKLKKLAI